MKDFKIYISIGCLLLLIYVVAQYNKPTPINWKSTLAYQDKIPYGTYILYHQLDDIFPGATISNNTLSTYQAFKSGLEPGNYFIIAPTVKINKNDFKAMLEYIKGGNSVFISAFNFDGFLSDTLDLETGIEYEKKSVGLNFTNNRLKKINNYSFTPDISNQYFKSFDTTRAVVLSKNEYGNSNYLRFNFGKGHLYLFANPQILTNYSLLNAESADYAAKALSCLPAANNIYWDLYYNGGNSTEDMSPMRVFFANPALRWAYYLSLSCLLLFILFEIKRRQRVIPVIEPLKNNTLEFVNVVGRVYFEQRNNTNIAHKKILYLFDHIRSKYQLKTNVLNQEFISSLSHKTGIDYEKIQSLVNYINYVGVQTNIKDNELISLNKHIEDFYKQSS